MTDEKLHQTLAALERGERPPCPWCGAERSPYGVVWDCGSELWSGLGGAVHMRRTIRCYEREIALLQESRRAQECISRQLQTRLAAALAEHARLCEAMRTAALQIAKGIEIEAEATLYQALGAEKDE